MGNLQLNLVQEPISGNIGYRNANAIVAIL
nr:MAG TPA_asm: hypothetical protein [Caudoviricetes sp.]